MGAIKKTVGCRMDWQKVKITSLELKVQKLEHKINELEIFSRILYSTCGILATVLALVLFL